MSAISQKDAVVNAVKQVMGNSFIIGTTQAKTAVTKDQLVAIRKLVADGILSGTVSYSKSIGEANAIIRYTNGMVDNHFRKAKELNGGGISTPSKPKAAKSPSDKTLKHLNVLLSTYNEGSQEYNQVKSAIAVRENELKAMTA